MGRLFLFLNFSIRKGKKAKMKLFTYTSLVVAAVTAQDDIYQDYYTDGDLSSYADDYYNNIDGMTAEMIEERRRTQAEKDAAKANRQKEKQKNKQNTKLFTLNPQLQKHQLQR